VPGEIGYRFEFFAMANSRLAEERLNDLARHPRPMMPAPMKPMFMPLSGWMKSRHIRFVEQDLSYVYYVTYDMSSKTCLALCCQAFRFSWAFAAIQRSGKIVLVHGVMRTTGLA
jgi:hypothetical protein